ncbi:hypothetical protein GCK72_002677 [Caenorhabditis remanei]|uniref:SGNH domain-containing protein n=1 Tax=Caenorhabditis remanei TaxID=31234 RepID=A0A6A5HWT1_CAERE|nr:hypothetical protein GCK72_002677 [Caenorhabditis remanei]KAF1770853.1 hypothetical protein GCK72_002677 [Caenorhabditis remanei]
MNVPSEDFIEQLMEFRERNGSFDDFRFMCKQEMRENLVNNYFPYNKLIARALFKNQHIMFIGDSLIRAMYKDFLALLQTGDLCTVQDLRVSNEDSIFGDKHIDFLELEANRVFRQAREFQSNQHLIQYFFTNRAMREDLEKTCLMIEATDERPDIVVMNSAIWDISRFPARLSQRWTSQSMDNLEEEINVAEDYYNRIAMFCRRMRVLLPPTSTVVWVLMPPSSTPESNVSGGFLANNHLKFYEIRARLLEANVRAAQIVREAGFDVLDLSFHFRLSNFQAFRIKDGVHFNNIATRFMNQLLIGHIADAWGIDIRRKWPQKLIDKTLIKSQLFNVALDFLQDSNKWKHRNEVVHQHLRTLAFENVKLPDAAGNPGTMTMQQLNENMRVLLMFMKFQARSQSDAERNAKAFAGQIPEELSRFSQEDLVQIGKMIKEMCHEWKGKLPCVRLATTNKRVHEIGARRVLFDTPPSAPPGINSIPVPPVVEVEGSSVNITPSSDGSSPSGVPNKILPPHVPKKKRRVSESRQ